MNRRAEAGVTLVEVLVVLAIVGVATGATVLGLGALDRGARGEAEARRLADRLGLAADEVLVTGVPLAMVWDARGYRFLSWDAQSRAWGRPSLPALAEAHALTGALRLTDAGGTGTEAPVLVTPDLPQPPVLLALDSAGGGAGWRVGFDGFAATAAPSAQ